MGDQTMRAVIQAFLVVAVLSLTACMLPNSAEKNIAKQKIADGALIVDVRSPKDYKAGHYAGATNIPLEEIKSQCDQLGDHCRPIVVYCYHGVMAAKAKETLVDAGFFNVSNAGGLSNLKQ